MTDTDRRKALRLDAELKVSQLSDADIMSMLDEGRRQLHRANMENSRLQIWCDALKKERGDRKIGQSYRRVSDHAVVRYLERVKGVDVEALRAEIVALLATAEPDGIGAYRTSDGLLIAVSSEAGVVSTIYYPYEEEFRADMVSG